MHPDGTVDKVPDLDALRRELETAKRDGIKAVAIVFMHAYRYPAHEQQVAGLARQMERVAHDDLGADLLGLRRHHGVDGAVGADRHEGWRMDVAAAGAQHAGPRHAARRRARLDLDC